LRHYVSARSPRLAEMERGQSCPFPGCDFVSYRGGLSKHMGHMHRCKPCGEYSFDCMCFW
jgi:hypothetical protein